VQIGAVMPDTLGSGKSATIAIPITNNGNVAATGPMTIQLGLSADGTTVASTLATFVRPVTIKPGATTTLHLRFRRPPGQAAGQFFPSVTLSHDRDHGIDFVVARSH
jgi:hypothetical protein